jgi:hypothetical protein
MFYRGRTRLGSRSSLTRWEAQESGLEKKEAEKAKNGENFEKFGWKNSEKIAKKIIL